MQTKPTTGLPTQKLYRSELDIDTAQVDAFPRWYAFRHTPDDYSGSTLVVARGSGLRRGFVRLRGRTRFTNWNRA